MKTALVESINVTFEEDGVITNNEEDLESLKLETEAEKDTDKILEQEATINQEEVNNDHQDKLLQREQKNGFKRTIHQIKSLVT